MNRRMLLSIACLAISACAAKPMVPGAETVIVSNEPATPDCRYLGEVEGAQGNFVLAQFTADRKLIEGARNELRNQAYGMGANYVHVQVQSLSHNTADDALGGTHTAVMVGHAFHCEDPYTILTRQ